MAGPHIPDADDRQRGIIYSILSEVDSGVFLKGPARDVLYDFINVNRERNPLLQEISFNPRYHYSPAIDAVVGLLMVAGSVSHWGPSEHIFEVKRPGVLGQEALKAGFNSDEVDKLRELGVEFFDRYRVDVPTEN